MFGSQDISPEEETQLLKEILSAPLPREPPFPSHLSPRASLAPETLILTLPVGQQRTEEQEAEEEEEEEEEELQVVQVSEKEFNFLDYLKRYRPGGPS